jgi:Cu(I)/Ag(I) efflux system membrane protein CusA/SilA
MAYIVRGLGYIKKNIKDVGHQKIIICPVRVKDIGSVQMGGDLRLGILMQMEKKWSAELW